MQRNLYQQALRMHGDDLGGLVERHLQGKCVFLEEDDEGKQLAEKDVECDERESEVNHPDVAPAVPHQQVKPRITGTMRDLVYPHPRFSTDSSTEGSSRSDTSPEILPLGVPRELHEPFEEFKKAPIWNRKGKTESRSDGFTSKLRDFIAKKADMLFTAPAVVVKDPKEMVQDSADLDYYAILPPVEQFMDIPQDQARKRFFEMLCVGDIVAGSIIAIKEFGMFVQVTCLCGEDSRFIQDCDVVGLLPKGELGDRFSQKAQLEDFRPRDIVRCRVVKSDAANEKVILTMINDGEEREDSILGIMNESELPVHYRRSQTQRETRELYDEMLDNTLGFDNPYNVPYLANMLQIDDKAPPSLMPKLQCSNFPAEEHAEALRKWQSHKWAMESVAKGVEHFKAGRHIEAMQQLNRALEIDAENVEGLVARGALFANQDNLSKAIKDFAEALRIKPTHKNANRYMCQTLFEKGKQCEESGEKEKAMDCYQSAVDINPDFKDASLSLQRLQKSTRRSKHDDSEDEEEDEGETSTSGESPPEQMSAKQLREMIDEDNDDKSSSKRKKKKDKYRKDRVAEKSDKKIKKEKKAAKKKKKKRKQRQGSVSTDENSKPSKREQSSDSESRSSVPSSPVVKETIDKKHLRTEDLKLSQSPELAQRAGRKRSRNQSLSPKRKSRSKTRKADLIRRKNAPTSSSSSSGDEKQIEEESKKGKNHRESVGRSHSKTKDKVEKKRSHKESESSSFSSPDEDNVKKNKKESKKPVKDGSSKKRKLKDKKEKTRDQSSSSISEESEGSSSESPMRKKSRKTKQPKKKLKKIKKRSKKRSESVSSDVVSESGSERKPSPPKKVHKKKKKKNKKKQKKRDRSPSSSSHSVVSSESPDRKKSQEESLKKTKHKKKAKDAEPPSSRSTSESSSEAKQVTASKEKPNRMSEKRGQSPIKYERRSRSVSASRKDRSRERSYGEDEIQIGKKRTRSSEFTQGFSKEDSRRRPSKEAIPSSPEERQEAPARHSSAELEEKKKDKHRERKRSESPIDDVQRSSEKDRKERPRHSAKDKQDEQANLDKKRSRRGSRSVSPLGLGEGEKRPVQEESKPDRDQKKKSHDSPSPKIDSLALSRKTASSKSHKQDKSSENVKSRENRDISTSSKPTRRSRSLSPPHKGDVAKVKESPIRDRKRKRSGSFKSQSKSPERSRQVSTLLDEREEERGRQRRNSGVKKESNNRKDSPVLSRSYSHSADSRTNQGSYSPRDRKKSDSKRMQSPSGRRDDRRRSWDEKDVSKGSPRDRKKSDSKRTPSPVGSRDNRHRSCDEKETRKDSRSTKSPSADVNERKQQSTSGLYDRDRDQKMRSKDYDKGQSRDRDRQHSESLDKGGRREEQNQSSDRTGPRNSEDSRHRSSERERPRSREEDRRKSTSSDTRRSSYDGKYDDRDRRRDDRNKERQHSDKDKSSLDRSRDHERSNERDRRDINKHHENSKDKSDNSREKDKESISNNKKRENKNESDLKRSEKTTDSKRDRSKEKEKSNEKQSNSKDHPVLNIHDIPMPAEKENKPAAKKKEPSPILYVTSGSCKDEIIKVKSKWDTDSEDDEDGPRGPVGNNNQGGAGVWSGQRYLGQSSQYSSGNVAGSGGGQNSGGYRRHNDPQWTQKGCPDHSVERQCTSMVFVTDNEPTAHEPLRLRGGCAASPAKYETDQYSDSDLTFSSSSTVDSDYHEVKNWHKTRRRKAHHKCSARSSSSDESSYDRSKKRFKQSSSPSQESSRSPSVSSSQSISNRSSSRSDISYSSRSRSSSSSSSSSHSSSSRSRMHHRSSRSSSSSSLSKSSSQSTMSKSSRSRRRQRKIPSRSESESSGSEEASAYMLFDSWEEYLDSKGHHFGKDLPVQPKDRRGRKVSKKALKKEEKGAASPEVSEAKDVGDKDDSTKASSYHQRKQNISSGSRGDGRSKSPQPLSNQGNGDDTHSECGRPDERKPDLSSSLDSTLPALSVLPKTLASKHNKESPSVNSGRSHSHSTKQAQNWSGDDCGSSGRSARGKDRGYYIHTPDRDFHSKYDACPPYSKGRGTRVGRDQPDKNYQRSRREEQHSRSSFDPDSRHREYRQHSSRIYESRRGGRRERFWRRDADWGRGVKETKESNVFFGLVSKSKETLISQLYGTCITAAEKIFHKHRQWWL